MREAKAIELHSGEQRQMFVVKDNKEDGFFTPRHLASECDMIKATLDDDGALCFRIIDWKGGPTAVRKYSYSGKYVIHWA